MSAVTTSDWILFGGDLATLLLVGVALETLRRQLRQTNRQTLVSQFSDYTKRYQEIALHFPEDINESSFLLEGRSDYASTMRYMRAYFDLCFEEWYLQDQGLLDNRLWRIWEGGMATAMSKPAFRQAWAKISKDSDYGVVFATHLSMSPGATT